MFPAQHGFISWHDITPHLGAAYDVFGNGKTAVKVSLNRYLESLSAGAPIAQDPNPLSSLITQTTRSWSDTNRNYVADCNLMSPIANGECGAMANASFGLPVPGATYDTNMTHGWGKRGYNWEFSTGVQHEVLPRTSVDVSKVPRSRHWLPAQLPPDLVPINRFRSLLFLSTPLVRVGRPPSENV